MKIWEDEKQVYIRASMERNTPEQNAALKERLEQIDWSILSSRTGCNPGRKSRSSAFSWRTGNKTGVGQTEGNIKYRCEPGTLFIRAAFP